MVRLAVNSPTLTESTRLAIQRFFREWLRSGGRKRYFFFVSHCDPLHFGHAHRNSGSSGIALWPQLSHCNQPSDRRIIVRNWSPNLQ